MTTRRDFVTRLGAAAIAGPLATGGALSPNTRPMLQSDSWDLSWTDRVRRAKHKAIFDVPSGDGGLMLAARFYENVQTVYKAKDPDVVAIVNARTRAVSLGLSNEMWAKYPIAEDVREKDATGPLSRKNPNFYPEPGWSEAYAATTIEKLHEHGLIILVCNFALGHLSSRLAKATKGKEDKIHAELQASLAPGGILVPSGIFGLTEAQNLGCAFVPGP